MITTAHEIQHEKKHFQTILRLFFCITVAGIALFAYIEKQNALTELRLAIPMLAKEVREIHEENTRLAYEIERFENPVLLMDLMRKPEFSHLKFPYLNEEIFLKEAIPFSQESSLGD